MCNRVSTSLSSMSFNQLNEHPVSQTILIVEDEFAVANDLRLILERAGYIVSGIALSVAKALELTKLKRPDFVLVDIYLKGPETGIDLARYLCTNQIPFVFLSANTNTSVLEEAKMTKPFGFLVKPFREKDVLVALEIAYYRHALSLESQRCQRQEHQINLLNTFAQPVNWNNWLLKLLAYFQTHIPFDFIQITVDRKQPSKAHRLNCYLRIAQDEFQCAPIADFTGENSQKSPLRQDDWIASTNSPDSDGDNDGYSHLLIKDLIINTYKYKSNLNTSVYTANNGQFLLDFYSQHDQLYHEHHWTLLEQLKPALTVTVNQMLAYDQLVQQTAQLHDENVSLRQRVSKLIG